MGQYFYFIGITLFVPLWVALFLKKDSRKDMVITGIILGVFAVLIEYLYARLDYWHPLYLFNNFRFEDFYYGFIFGGISSELYSLIFNTRNSIKPRYKENKKMVILFIVIILLSFFVLINIFHMNSIVSHIIPPLFVGIIVSIYRRDLIKLQLFNGLFMAIITVMMFFILMLINPNIFNDYWMLKNLTGIYFIKIPIEELLFAFSLGFGAGGVYEFIYGYKEIKQNKQK